MVVSGSKKFIVLSTDWLYLVFDSLQFFSLLQQFDVGLSFFLAQIPGLSIFGFEEIPLFFRDMVELLHIAVQPLHLTLQVRDGL